MRRAQRLALLCSLPASCWREGRWEEGTRRKGWWAEETRCGHYSRDGRAEPRGFSCRLAEEAGDEVYKEETRPAAESLVLAGRHVLLAARELCAHPDIPSHRERLAAAAKRVLAQAGKVAPDGHGAEASSGGGWARRQQGEGCRRTAISPAQGRGWGSSGWSRGCFLTLCSHQGRSAGQNTSALPTLTMFSAVLVRSFGSKTPPG